MSSRTRNRLIRQLDRAEGYLMLDMPDRALAILEGRSEWGGVQFEASFLTGEALRALGRYREALKPLERAAMLRPDDLGVAISLGWCYKRTHRLAQAIDALMRAAREHPEEPLLHYNLACYWALAGNPLRALDELGSALDLDPDLHARIADEPDFHALRDLEGFARLISGKTPSA
jgi:tetratricopeptide (TPR) repeat protein